MKASCGIERPALKMVSNSYTSYFDHCDNGGQTKRCLCSTDYLSDGKSTYNVSERWPIQIPWSKRVLAE